MKPKIAILYVSSNNESLVAKNKAKRENPNAVIIEASNTKAVKEILNDDNYQVISCDKSLNARVALSEEARLKAKSDALAAQHAKLEKKEAPKKAAPKKEEAKKAAPKKEAKKVAPKKAAATKKKVTPKKK